MDERKLLIDKRTSHVYEGAQSLELLFYRTGTQVPFNKTNPAISITSWSLITMELIMVSKFKRMIG